MRHLRHPFRVSAPLLIALAVGCVSAPVQEMSDARQALKAAEQAEAHEKAPDSYGAARSLLEQAEQHLDAGNYRAARESAMAAKERAIAARQESVTSD